MFYSYAEGTINWVRNRDAFKHIQMGLVCINGNGIDGEERE
jgi:hypothetical protein